MELEKAAIVAGDQACQTLPKERYAMEDDITCSATIWVI
jgi:hypothetical protein